MPQSRQPLNFGITILLGIFLWAAILGAASVAFGQTVTSGSASNSRADAGARSDSLSGAQINQTFQGSPARQDFGYSGGTNNTTRVEGTTTLRNVPSIYAPSFGGTNPCTVSASGGGAVAGFGITLGGSWASAECERRNLAVIAVQALNDAALAHEILCGTADFRAARMRMGAPCAEDRPVDQPAAVASAPMSTPAPVEPIAYTPREPGRLIRQSIPAWCDTVGPRDPPAAQAACGRVAAPR